MNPYYKQNILFFLSILLLFPVLSHSQHKAYFIGDGEPSLSKVIAQAKVAYDSSDFYNAYQLYGEAIKIDQNNIEHLYEHAESAREYGAFCIAKDAYGRLLVLDSLQSFPEVTYKFAKMNKLAGDYSKADSILASLNYHADAIEGTILDTLVEKEWLDLEYIEETLTNPIPNGHIESKHDSINTLHAEYNPVWREGQLYYGSMAFQKSKDEVQPARGFTKTMRFDGDSITVWDNFNFKDKSTTHLSFTPDDRRVYFTVCDYKNNRSDIRCEIYYRDKIKGTTNDWGEAIPLPKKINRSRFTSTHPSYGLNEKNEPGLYYASDKGKGKDMDIWFTKIENDSTFADPVILDNGINTDYDEITPFYHHSSNTLYFSSNGHKGLGGYDINKWDLEKASVEINNLGVPFNSSLHDFNFFLKSDTTQAFFVSNRDGCDTIIDQIGCHDIYEVDMCNTQLKIYLFDLKEKPLLNGKLLVKYNAIELNDTIVDQNCFTYQNIPAYTYVEAMASHEDYSSIDTILPLKACEDNIHSLYLPCEPILTINVFGENEDSTFALNQDNIILQVQVPNGQEVQEQSFFTKSSNAATFKIDPKLTYDISVFHQGYLSRTIRVTDMACADTLIIIKLNPDIIIDDDAPIVCYFDHDVPARIRVNGEVDKSQEENSQFNYDIYYENYISRQQTFENIFPDKTAIKEFFKDSVITQHDRLVEFREDVYASLKANSDVNYEITIKGYCSHLGKDDYNMKLASRRVEAVSKFFQEKLSNYIGKDRIKINPLAIGELPEIIYLDQKKMNGEYNPESSRQRRVEVIAIKKIIKKEPTVVGSGE